MNSSERLRDQHYNHVFIEISWLNSLPVSRISTWKCSSQTNSNCWAIFSRKIRLTVHLSEALTDIHPLETHPPFPLTASCSGILSARRPFSQIKHALVLGSEVTWPSDNAPIVAGCSIRIKEVINQLTGLWGQYCPFTGETVQPLTALGADWETRALLLYAEAVNMKPK